MARFLKNREASLGKAPGELVFIGEQKIEESSIRLVEYNEEQLDEKIITDIQDVAAYKDESTTSWVNVFGVHDMDLIRSIGQHFELHGLVLEDISNTGQRPKMEDYDEYCYFTLKMIRYDGEDEKIYSDQISLVLGKSFLITFQEHPTDFFLPLRERLRKNKGRIRKAGTDYLAYTLLDAIVDNYIVVIERLGGQIEDIETEILDNPSQEVLVKINNYKREINYLRKSIRPAKEFMQQLSRIDSNLFREQTMVFLKDLHDLACQSVEVIDSYREMLSDHLNIYNTGVNNRLNEIMKILTVFSVIFIPLTFIAGIYGTNFSYIPELQYRYGYFILWGVMLVLALGMILFFKSKKWL